MNKIKQYAQQILGWIINQLFPQQCIICQQSSEGPIFCCACLAGLPRMQTACGSCALPVTTTRSLCGRCQKKPPPVDLAKTLFYYQPPITQAIFQLKFSGKIRFAKFFGSLLTKAISKENLQADFLVPVPLHKKRLRERGFNQAIELAKPISKALNIPICRQIKRITNTPTQIKLNAKQRQKNIRNAFSTKQSFKNKRLIIIDDVVTTTATTHELAKLLKKNGAKMVAVFSVARAV